MASWYVNPGLGSGTNAGTSWANAFNSTTTSWTDAITASSAGDDFYVNAASTVSNASAQTLTFKGTSASPNRVFSCSTITNNPPVTGDLGVGAAHTTTGNSGQTISGHVYIYGCTFNMGTGAVNPTFTFVGGSVDSDITLETCKIITPATGATANITIGGNVVNLGQRVTWRNTTLKFGNAGQGINLTTGMFRWENTASAIDNAGSIPTNLFLASASAVRTYIATCIGVDFSAITSKALVAATAGNGVLQFVDCLYGASTTFTAPSVAAGLNIDQVVSDVTTGTYAQGRTNYSGTSTADNTIYNNATDGVTPISWKVVATANCSNTVPFECFDIVQWVSAGTYAASTIMVTSATASLTNNDVWVVVDYLGSTYPGASKVTSGNSPLIPGGSSPTNLSAGSWVHSGQGNNYQLTIPSFTTSAAGYVTFRVRVGKASLTAWIDPAVTVA